MICGPFAASCCLNSEVFSGHLAWLSVLHPNCVEFAALCSGVQLGWCSRVLLWVLEPVLCFDWKELVWLSGFFIHANTPNCHSSYRSITSLPVCLSPLGQCASAAGLPPSPVCCCWQPCPAPLLLHLLCTGKNDPKLFAERGWSFSSSALLVLAWSPSGVCERALLHILNTLTTALCILQQPLAWCWELFVLEAAHPAQIWTGPWCWCSQGVWKWAEPWKPAAKASSIPSSWFASLPPHSKQIVLTDKSRIMVRRFARQQDYGS